MCSAGGLQRDKAQEQQHQAAGCCAAAAGGHRRAEPGFCPAASCHKGPLAESHPGRQICSHGAPLPALEGQHVAIMLSRASCCRSWKGKLLCTQAILEQLTPQRLHMRTGSPAWCAGPYLDRTHLSRCTSRHQPCQIPKTAPRHCRQDCSSFSAGTATRLLTLLHCSEPGGLCRMGTQCATSCSATCCMSLR